MNFRELITAMGKERAMGDTSLVFGKLETDKDLHGAEKVTEDILAVNPDDHGTGRSGGSEDGRAATHEEIMEAARILIGARKEGGLSTLCFSAMVDDMTRGHDVTVIEARKPLPVQVTEEAADGVQDDSGPERHGEDQNAPEQDDYRVRGQFGARARDTYYRNLPAFVQGFFANVFAFVQTTQPRYQWVPDWWRYPQLVFPLDAMWRAYEAARKQPAGMMPWYIQAFGVMDRVFNPDVGVVASLGIDQIYTDRGEKLPCEQPPKDWRARITEQLAAGHDEPVESNPADRMRHHGGPGMMDGGNR